MREVVTGLSPEDAINLEEARNWLRAHLVEEDRPKYEQLGIKLSLIDQIIKGSLYDPANEAQLQALGVGLGDAITQEKNMIWAVVDDQFGRAVMIQVPNTSIKLFVITAIQKRLENGEEVEILPLLYAFCDQIDQIKQNLKPSLFQRIFGKRVV